MAMITDSIKSILAVKIKPRHDSYTDQFTRIFMPKMMVISSLIMSVNWFHDTVTCMVPNDSHLTADFVHSACWIQGFYVYPEMMSRLDECSYYGIPRNMDFNGQDYDGKLCQTTDRTTHQVITSCKPMTKRYFLQYQWMPFYVASLSLLCYMPYVLFRIINTDMMSLKNTLDTTSKLHAEKIVSSYFNYEINSPSKLRICVFMNFCNKLLYVAANVTAFRFTNDLLGGNYVDYGLKWSQWMNLNHTSTFDFHEGNIPKPGNVLLPSFGFCEIQEASMDVRNVFFNKNKFICEISPNILYQYTFIVLWFCMVLSIAIAIIGVVLNLAGHFVTMGCCLQNLGSAKQIYRSLTLRECEYLTYIRRTNIPLYGEILRKIHLMKNEVINDHSAGFNGSVKCLNANGNYRPLSQKATAPIGEPVWRKL